VSAGLPERMAIAPCRHATMALDPGLVTLTDHGTTKLHSAVSQVMTLLPKERKRATIVRAGDPAVLKFDQIKNLARWQDNGSRRSTRAPQRWPVNGPVTPLNLTIAGPRIYPSQHHAW
jgi:hypothetical protein